MGKMLIINGKPHRIRRGKAVEIPAEWLGKIVHEQTKRKRDSHKTKGQRNGEGRSTKNSGWVPSGYFDAKNFLRDAQ